MSAENDCVKLEYCQKMRQSLHTIITDNCIAANKGISSVKAVSNDRYESWYHNNYREALSFYNSEEFNKSKTMSTNLKISIVMLHNAGVTNENSFITNDATHNVELIRLIRHLPDRWKYHELKWRNEYSKNVPLHRQDV